jgi:uncharacterized protein with von Willebrand factor type A (vWA) domain
MSLTDNLVAFGRILRRAGLDVTPESTRLFGSAIAAVGFDRKDRVRAAGRSIYARRREDREVFDRAFALFWRRYGGGEGDSPSLPRIRQDQRRAPTFPAEAPADVAVDGTPPSTEPALASALERLTQADFAALTPAEARDALSMIAALRPALPMRPSRRWRRHRRGGRPATARMLRAALRTEGEPLVWRWLAHPRRPRPIVLICDISGSMERYSRLMLRFAHAMSQSGAPVEVFAFGTRLTRITRELRVRDPDVALARIGRTVVDWNGGTRIGESLHELNRRWVRRTIRSGAIVLIVSDGWERGDPAQLALEMARLRRSCYRLYWLDPLASQPGFAPEVQGLKVATPFIDALLPCASVASLVGLAARLSSEL